MKKYKNFYLYHAQTNTKTLISPREVECINHLLRGKTSKQIGKTLLLSHRTVEFYISSLRDKLDCHNKSELIEKILSGTLIDRSQSESQIAQTHQQIRSSFQPWIYS